MAWVDSLVSRLLDEEQQNQTRYCKVYDRDDFFTALVQMVLALAALASLYWKRLREVPRRTFRTWLLDVSKQGIGACYAHLLNMIIASVISNNIRGDTVLYDQCAWYGLSYLIDTTLGLVLAILFLNLLDRLAHERDWVHLKHSGVYAGVHGIWTWFAQVMAWLGIQTVVKLIIYLFMWLGSAPLAWLGAILFAPIQFNIRFELVFVMILFPGLLNVIYFWIADSYLKAKADPAHVGAFEKDDTGLMDRKERLVPEGEGGEPEVERPHLSLSGAIAPWSSYFAAYNVFGAAPTEPADDNDAATATVELQPPPPSAVSV